MQQVCNYIDGKFVEPAGGEYLDVVDPATGAVYCQVPDSDERDVGQAVEAAEKAFPGWSRTPADERSKVLLRIADLIESNIERLALAECIDTGKPLSLARGMDIPRAAANFRFFATAILHTHSEMHATDGQALNYTLRQPRGVVGLISPWNLPLYLLSWKVAPAIATGNCAIGKPSEITPMTAFMLSELCMEAKLPSGVLNVVHGQGRRAGGAIICDPRIATISFTGGSVTGAEIAREAGPGFKKVSLELGGKNPNIVFADAASGSGADLDHVVAESMRASFANQGQICLCGSRLYVQQPLFDEFVSKFVKATRSLNVGDPLEPDTDQGAVVSRRHFDKVISYIELARDEGGTILCGGGVPLSLPDRCRNGFFIEPTVLTDLDVNCRVNQEEIFGPVVTISPFETGEEVVGYANAASYGLSASVWTSNLSTAHRVAERIQAGTVWVNCWLLRDLRVPFGGMKRSGTGREGGEEALRFFTEPKNVCIRLPNE